MRRPIIASIIRGRSVSCTAVKERRRTIAQDLHAVRDHRHLIEAMRDVDDGHPLIAQSPDEAEQRFGLVVRKRSGRLIEDQQPGRLRQGSGDLDDLPFADAQGANGAIDVEVHPELVKDRPGTPSHGAP